MLASAHAARACSRAPAAASSLPRLRPVTRRGAGAAAAGVSMGLLDGLFGRAAPTLAAGGGDGGGGVSKSGYAVDPLTKAEVESLAKELPQMSQYVTMQEGTERAFTGETANGYKWDTKK